MGEDNQQLPEQYYPDERQLEIDFRHARPFNRYLGDAIIDRDGGVNEATRVGGLRRESRQNRRIEIWHIRAAAYLLRVRHLNNSFYFEINEPNLVDEITSLIEDGDWWIDYLSYDKLVASIPDEYLPEEGHLDPLQG